jgi:hypothetical protein
MNISTRVSTFALVLFFAAGTASAAGVTYKDPTGDDKGPGTYI